MAKVNNATGVYATLGYNFSDPNGAVQTFSANTQANLQQFPPIINEWQAKDLADNNVGGYFQNPVYDQLNTIKIKSDAIYQACNTALSSPGVDPEGSPLPPSYSGPDLSAIMAASNSVTIQANTMIFHTNKVSGVTPLEGQDDIDINPYYQTITSYGKQVIYITNQTDDIVDNSPIMGCLTSLLVVPEFTDYASNVTSFLTKVNSIISTNSDTTGSLPGMVSKLNEMQSFMVERRGHDVTFFTNVKNTVKKFTQLSGFTNAGETEKYLLNNVVGTDKLKSRISS